MESPYLLQGAGLEHRSGQAVCGSHIAASEGSEVGLRMATPARGGDAKDTHTIQYYQGSYEDKFIATGNKQIVNKFD